MAITCEACGHWSLSGEHDCPVVWKHAIKEGISEAMHESGFKQIVIQLPANPGPIYDDLLIALEQLVKPKGEGGE